jgi:hypothetical protein
LIYLSSEYSHPERSPNALQILNFSGFSIEKEAIYPPVAIALQNSDPMSDSALTASAMASECILVGHCRINAPPVLTVVVGCGIGAFDLT